MDYSFRIPSLSPSAPPTLSRYCHSIPEIRRSRFAYSPVDLRAFHSLLHDKCLFHRSGHNTRERTEHYPNITVTARMLRPPSWYTVRRTYIHSHLCIYIVCQVHICIEGPVEYFRRPLYWHSPDLITPRRLSPRFIACSNTPNAKAFTRSRTPLAASAPP